MSVAVESWNLISGSEPSFPTQSSSEEPKEEEEEVPEDKALGKILEQLSLGRLTWEFCFLYVIRETFPIVKNKKFCYIDILTMKHVVYLQHLIQDFTVAHQELAAKFHKKISRTSKDEKFTKLSEGVLQQSHHLKESRFLLQETLLKMLGLTLPKEVWLGLRREGGIILLEEDWKAVSHEMKESVEKLIDEEGFSVCEEWLKAEDLEDKEARAKQNILKCVCREHQVETIKEFLALFS